MLGNDNLEIFQTLRLRSPSPHPPIFSKKINAIESKLYSDKNDVIRRQFPTCTSSYLFPYKQLSCSTGETHLNALIYLVETTLYTLPKK